MRTAATRVNKASGSRYAALLATLTVLLWLAPRAAMAETARVSLDGTWLACRTATAEPPPAAGADWHEATVPARVPMNNRQPYLWYRRAFDAPPVAAGSRLYLCFESVAFVSTVYVNGRAVGGHAGGWEPFEFDITAAVRPEGPNELIVRAQDMTGLTDEPLDEHARGPGIRLVDQFKDSILAPVGSQYSKFGIWQPVNLVVRRDVYVDDVWVRTFVRAGRIEVDVTVRNTAPERRTVSVAARIEDAPVTFASRDVVVPANGSNVVHFASEWRDPRLWCPDDPHLYHAVAAVSQGGNSTADTLRVRFGFREFRIAGDRFLLNEIPMTFLATAGHPSGTPKDSLLKADAAAYYGRLREAGCTAMRLHANVWPRAWYAAADEVGLPIIMESALFCYCRGYALTRPEFWRNYRTHLRAIIRAHRNHPSIVMMSLENEILHCGGDRYAADCEHRLADAGRMVKAFDPTRPIMYDADADPEGVTDVVNLHYPVDFDRENLWPNTGYWLETGKKVAGWPHTFWTWDHKKPLYFGEFLHLQHYTQPDPYTTLLGESAYADGLRQAMARAKAEAWSMQIRAYRADNVSGLCPWTLTETGDFPATDNPRYLAVKRTYQKQAAFIRELDTRFFADDTVRRTIDLYNDVPRTATLTLAWTLTDAEGTPVDSGSRESPAEPAAHVVVPIDLRMPAAARRTPLALRVTVAADGHLVFDETYAYTVFPRYRPRLPEDVALAVFEGDNHTLSQALSAAGVRSTRVDDLTKLPATGVLLVGAHALDAPAARTNACVIGDASTPRAALARFAAAGGGVVVLEQDAYGEVLPLHVVDRGCTIAFDRAPGEGVAPDDAGVDALRFWRGDHVVARKTIAKPSSGRFRALVDSGGRDGLTYTVIVEQLEGRGRIIMSQAAIAEKLAIEPMAGLLLNALIARAAHPCPPARLAVIAETASQMAATLDECGVRFETVSSRLDAAGLSGYGVLLAEAAAPELEARRPAVRAFADAGGTVVLHGVTPAALRRLEGLLPESVAAGQSSGATPPVIAARADPLLDGLSNQELYWYGDRKDLNWREITPIAPGVCSNVLTVGLPDPATCRAIEAESMTLIDGQGRAADGNVSMHTYGKLETTVDIPATGDYGVFVRGRGTPLEGIFPTIGVSVDGTTVGTVALDSRDWTLGALRVKLERGTRRIAVAFTNDKWNPDTREDRNACLDKLLIGPARATPARVLLAPAALIAMPCGKGRFVLDQVNWPTETHNADKARRYISTLLANLGVDFADAGDAVTIAGAAFVPDKGVKLYRQTGGTAALGTNGRISTSLTVAHTGRYRLAIRAQGTPAAGEYPNIRVDVDGTPVGNVQLQRDGWCTLRLSTKLTAGPRVVGLAFTNDFYDPPADRNLSIDGLTIRPAVSQ